MRSEQHIVRLAPVPRQLGRDHHPGADRELHRQVPSSLAEREQEEGDGHEGDGFLREIADPEAHACRDAARQPFSAQPKVYYDDGTSQLLHIYDGETREEAEAKANEELQKVMSQRV